MVLLAVRLLRDDWMVMSSVVHGYGGVAQRERCAQVGCLDSKGEWFIEAWLWYEEGVLERWSCEELRFIYFR